MPVPLLFLCNLILHWALFCQMTSLMASSCRQEMTPFISGQLFCYLLLCAIMHNSTLPFHISYATKRHIELFSQYWHSELLEQLVLAGIPAPLFAIFSTVILLHSLVSSICKWSYHVWIKPFQNIYIAETYVWMPKSHYNEAMLKIQCLKRDDAVERGKAPSANGCLWADQLPLQSKCNLLLSFTRVVVSSTG